MRIIVEIGVGYSLEFRCYRLNIPDDARLTWQAPNPTTKTADAAANCLRIYKGKQQIAVIPQVVAWRNEEIAVEEFVQPRGVIGKAWLDKKDTPMLEEHEAKEPIPVESNQKDEAFGNIKQQVNTLKGKGGRF